MGKKWIALQIFDDFLINLDAQMRPMGQQIIIFADQCAAQTQNTDHLKNIKFVFFPTNCSSHLLPLNMGIIRSFKN